MTKNVIHTNIAPKALGPYSQAIEANGFIFCSGQVAIEPETGKIIEDSSIEAQTHRVMKNLKAVLKAANVDFKDVVKTTIYTTDLSQFSKINEIYGSYFKGTNPPARSTVQMAALPLNVSIEIDMIAAKS